MNAIKKLAVLAVSVASTAAFAQATSVDLTPLTDAVNFESVITGVMAIAAAVVGVYLAIKGAQWILRQVRSA